MGGRSCILSIGTVLADDYIGMIASPQRITAQFPLCRFAANKIGFDGAEKFAEAMQMNSALKKLHLASKSSIFNYLFRIVDALCLSRYDVMGEAVD